jgi:hypothetical protein
MNIAFLKDFNDELTQELTAKIENWQQEVASLLPNNPVPSLVKFDNYYLIPGHGTGGFADAGNVLILAYDLKYPNKSEQLNKLRASYLHESFHIGQGWVGDVKLSPIAEAILEGAATVFERDRAGTQPEWSKYYDKNQMYTLLSQVLDLDESYDHDTWKYYDPSTGRSHLLYRLGTFIIDEALARNPELTIESLVTKKADEILQLSRLDSHGTQ